MWFCVTTTLGDRWWQLRGWPVNWIIQLDPLVGLATLLSTRTLYAGLLWGLVTVVLTIIFGRFFCGWVCPFGALHHLVAEVLDVIRELAESGMTMIIATHEMGFAGDIADRICFLEQGQILEDGPPSQVFGDPREARTREFLQRVIDAGRL